MGDDPAWLRRTDALQHRTERREVRLRSVALSAAATLLAPSIQVTQQLDLNPVLSTAEKLAEWLRTGQRPTWPDRTETPTK